MCENDRTCKSCGETKPISEFNYRKDSGTYRWKCKICMKSDRRTLYEKDKESVSKQVKEWRKKNYEYWQKSRAKYYRENKKAFSDRNKKWVKNNKDKVAKWARERRKQPYYKLREAHRGLMRRTFNGKKSDIGYTKGELKTHLESLFVDGMCWENYGEWEIDHIKPVRVFWEQGITDPKIVNALSNLQPLWRAENRKKSDKWVDD